MYIHLHTKRKGRRPPRAPAGVWGRQPLYFVCMCMCMYICMYVCIYIYIYIDTYIYIYIYIDVRSTAADPGKQASYAFCDTFLCTICPGS